MMLNNTSSGVSVTGETADDIRSLEDAFALTAFDYIDIARQEKLSTLFARWPLLAECLADKLE